MVCELSDGYSSDRTTRRLGKNSLIMQDLNGEHRGCDFIRGDMDETSLVEPLDHGIGTHLIREQLGCVMQQVLQLYQRLDKLEQDESLLLANRYQRVDELKADKGTQSAKGYQKLHDVETDESLQNAETNIPTNEAKIADGRMWGNLIEKFASLKRRPRKKRDGDKRDVGKKTVIDG